MFCSPASSTSVWSSAPSGLGPARNGRGQRRTLPQSPVWQTGSRNNTLVMNIHKFISDCLDPWPDAASNYWPLKEHHYAEVHPVCMSIQIEVPPFWSGLLSSSARAVALSEDRARCLNSHDDSHSHRQCMHPFQHLSGILNARR